MTDRFYPVPAKAEPAHVTPGIGQKNIGPFDKALYQTSYTAQNAMRTFIRSSFPPGYGGHQPGVQDKFGYGSPGPEPGVLARPESSPGLKDLAQTRRDDALEQLWNTGPGRFGNSRTDRIEKPAPLPRAYSLPKFDRPTGLAAAAQRLMEGPLEDAQRKYFVPLSIRRTVPRHRLLLNQNRLTSVDLMDPLTAGEGVGTGFNAQSPGVSWWPVDINLAGMTMYRTAFQEKPYHPKSGFIVP